MGAIRRVFEPRLAALAVGVALALAVLAVGANASVPGMNGKIVFTSTRDGNQEIYVMNADGSQPSRLTNNSVNDIDPAWSPDGKKIVYASACCGSPEFPQSDYEIYVMNADGTAQKPLTSNQLPDSDPTWSPDGKRIAFQRPTGEGNDIWVMNADGTGQKPLTTEGDGNGHPYWSPDGKKIAFTSQKDGSAEIYTMNADGGNPKRLTFAESNEYQPVWSPDGKQIAYTSDQDGDNEVYVMSSDGSDKKRMTKNAKNDESGDWSPDGRKVLISSDRDDPQKDIYAIDVSSLGATRLTPVQGVDYDPSWQSIPAPNSPSAPSGNQGGDQDASTQASKTESQRLAVKGSSEESSGGASTNGSPGATPISSGESAGSNAALEESASESGGGFPFWVLGAGLGGAAVIGSGGFIAWRRYRGSA